jgi:hypothetical protein
MVNGEWLVRGRLAEVVRPDGFGTLRALTINH